MVLSAFVDAFNIGTGAVASTVARTGYGFQPKACVYFWSGRTDAVDAQSAIDVKLGIGVAVSATDRRCVTTQSQQAAGTMVTNRKHNDAQCIECLTNTGTLDGNADLQSFDSDGQTLVIDDQFATSLRIHCLALGGADLAQAATFQVQAPLATGTQDVTVGFQPDALLLFSVGYATAPPASTTVAMHCIGLVGGAAQSVEAGFDNNGTTSSSAARYRVTSECIALFGAVNTLVFRAAWTSMLSTGFRLTWNEVDGATQPYVMGLALRGGGYKVGEVATLTNTTTPIVVSGLGFQPRGALFLGHVAALSTVDTAQTEYWTVLGAMTSPTNRGTQSVNSRTVQANASLQSMVNHVACYGAQVTGAPTSIEALMDVQSIDADGFTLIMDDQESSGKPVAYFAVGDGAAVASTLLPKMMQHAG